MLLYEMFRYNKDTLIGNVQHKKHPAVKLAAHYADAPDNRGNRTTDSVHLVDSKTGKKHHFYDSMDDVLTDYTKV